MIDRELDEKLLQACEYELARTKDTFEKACWKKAVDEWKKLLDK